MPVRDEKRKENRNSLQRFLHMCLALNFKKERWINGVDGKRGLSHCGGIQKKEKSYIADTRMYIYQAS